MGGRARAAFDWTFRSRVTGKVTIAQRPNLSLGLFLAGSLVRRLVHLTGAPRTSLDVAVAVSLSWWAADEIIRGVNPWRRGLGTGVLALLIAGLVSR